MIKEVNVSLYSKKDKSKLNIVLNVVIGIILVFMIFEIIFATKYTGIYVVGPSMNDTLTGATEFEEGGWTIADTSGDYVYVDRYAKPTYGDIVVVSKNLQTTIIKRVIALGGDYVKLVKGELWIKYSPNSAKYSGVDDFELVEENYVTDEKNDPNKAVNTFYNDDNGYYVMEGYLFLLGDHRNVSVDSRERGGTLYSVNSVYGVVTDWSLSGKSFFTAVHKYFSFDLPACFGIDNRIKRAA